MNKTERQIREILENQKLGVLSTYNPDYMQPYSSIVAFAFTDDLRYIYFATPRATRKFNNIRLNPKISMLIDSRKNDGKDIGKASAITIMGNSYEEEANGTETSSVFLEKHPELTDFIKSPTTALITVKVSKYILVNRFQDVTELDMD